MIPRSMTQRILLKFPTKYRLAKSLSVLEKYISLAENAEQISIVVSIDADDAESVGAIAQYEAVHPGHVSVCVGPSEGKIAAINRDLPPLDTFDILLLGSDDMIPVVKAYDRILREKMAQYFPDTDGVLFFNDGYQKHHLNTLVICGSAYYARFGYIYHPEYKSFYCDQEFTNEGFWLKKQQYFDEILIRHEHPMFQQNVGIDQLYVKNQEFWKEDKETYARRFYQKTGRLPPGESRPGPKKRMQFV